MALANHAPKCLRVCGAYLCRMQLQCISGESGSMASSSLSVLIAEDNEDIVVLLAGDGRHALDLALAEHPTLVLMDMDMPVMSGFDAVAALRARGYRGSIYALTAYQDGPEAERALSSGCDALLGKPITSERLRSQVAQALARVASASVQ